MSYKFPKGAFTLAFKHGDSHPSYVAQYKYYDTGDAHWSTIAIHDTGRMHDIMAADTGLYGRDTYYDVFRRDTGNGNFDFVSSYATPS